jgi:hypothetical protein
MSTLTEALAALAPPVGVGVVFWLAMRAIVRADSAERAAIARMAEHDKGDSAHE